MAKEIDVMAEFDNLVASCHMGPGGGVTEDDPDFTECHRGCREGIKAVRSRLSAYDALIKERDGLKKNIELLRYDLTTLIEQKANNEAEFSVERDALEAEVKRLQDNWHKCEKSLKHTRGELLNLRNGHREALRQLDAHKEGLKNSLAVITRVTQRAEKAEAAFEAARPLLWEAVRPTPPDRPMFAGTEKGKLVRQGRVMKAADAYRAALPASEEKV